MKNVVSGLLLLALGALSSLTGVSARVWRRGESRYRLGAILFGVICIAMGVFGLLGYIDIQEWPCSSKSHSRLHATAVTTSPRGSRGGC